jgi:2-phosphosulfolactate phosphatase
MTVVIDSFPFRNDRHLQDYAVVAIDVIRASTTAITAVAAGRKCFPVVSVEAAFQLREQFPDCLLAGEVSGLMPAGFDMNNSPAELARRSDHERPLVLLSSSGTKLMVESGTSSAAYVACLRNYKAVAAHIARRHERIAVLGAATRGEFREEDQLCCTRIAAELVRFGHQAEDRQTVRLIQRWSTSSVLVCAAGNSAAYLRRSGQLDDLNFILSHVNDVALAFQMSNGEIVPVSVVGEADKKRLAGVQRTQELETVES